MDVKSIEFRELCQKWHNKMWLWISKEIGNYPLLHNGSTILNRLKNEFLVLNIDSISQDFGISVGGIDRIMSYCFYCFACYYAKSISGAKSVLDYIGIDIFCHRCPVHWIPKHEETNNLFFCENSDSLYGGLQHYAVTSQECPDVCRVIADLPWDRYSEG